MPRFSNRPFLATTLSFLSSRAADLPVASYGRNEHGSAVFAIQAQRAGTKSAQPGRAGPIGRRVERRRCGTTLFVCSLGAYPDFLSRVAASVNCMWFSLGRTT